MRPSPFICQWCLSKLRQRLRPSREPGGATGVRWVSDIAPGAGPNANRDAAMTQEPSDRPMVPIRKYEPFPVFRRYVPKGDDGAYKSALESLARQSRQSAVSRDFDATNYSPDDTAFWSKFQELWETSGPGGPNALRPDPDATRKRKPVYRLGAGTAGRAAQRLPAGKDPQQRGPHPSKRRPNWNLVHGQREHLLQQLPEGEDKALALTRFRRWKRGQAHIWEMLLAGTIPTTKEMPMLKQLLQHADHKAMQDAWQLLSLEKRRHVWPDVILSALRSNPAKVAMIFKATFSTEVTPSYPVRDLIHLLLRQPNGKKWASANHVTDILRLVLENSCEGYLQLRQQTILMLLQQLEGPDLADLYRLLLTRGHPLHVNTQLQFASRLARQAAHKEQAMAILESMVAKTALDINSPPGLSLCTSILTAADGDSAQGAEEGVLAEVFARLLDLGLRPNVILYTTIIRQLCRASRFHSAWDIFQLVLEQKIEPDAVLYSTLMNGAKRAQDLDAVGQLVRLFLAQKMADVPVWNDFLHTILMAALDDSKREGKFPRRNVPVFPLMLDAFTKLFRTAAFHQLIGAGLPPPSRTLSSSDGSATLRGRPFFQKLAPVVQGLPQAASDELLEPDTATLTIMLAGYLTTMSKPYDVMVFYARFRKLVKEGHPEATRIVHEEGTIVHDMVIKALCEWPGMIRVALDVVSDMLKGALAAADVSNRGSARNSASPAPQHPRPSVHTFSILLHAFKTNKQAGQAERVLQMMREQQIKPNRVTWNTLLSSYASFQDMQKTIWALRSMEGSGYAADDYTFKAFRNLRPHVQRRALDELEKSMAGPQESGPGRGGLSTPPSEPLAAPAHELRRLEAEIDDIGKSLSAAGRGRGYAADDDVDIDEFAVLADSK